MANTLEFIISLQDKFSAVSNKVAASFNKVTGNSNKLNQSIEDLKKRLEVAQNAMQVTHNRNAFKFYYDEAKKLEKQINRLEQGITNSSIGGKIAGWRKDFATSLPGANLMKNPIAMAGASVGGFWMATSKAMEAGKEKMRLQVLTGSQEIGTALYDGLTKFATDTVFGNEIYDLGARMVSYGIQQSEVMPLMQQLGDISQGDAQKLDSLTLAFSRANAMGKLMGQELNMMIDTGFHTLEVISGQTGESMESLMEKMRKGEITIDLLRDAMTIATSDGGRFHNMLGQIADTPYGQLEGLRGQMEQMVVSIGEVFIPIATKVMSIISWLGEKAGPILKPFAAVLGTVSIALLALAAAQWVANLAVWAFPGVWIIAGIVALIAAIAWLVTSVSGWGDAWQHTMDGAKLAFQAFVQYHKSHFTTFVEGILIGITKLQIAWTKFKNFIGIGDKDANKELIGQLENAVKVRQERILDGYKKTAKLALQSADQFKKAGQSLKWEPKNFGIDMPGIPGMGKPLGLADLDLTTLGGGGSDEAQKTNSAIATGGTKHNYITINLQDLVGVLNIEGKSFRETTAQMEEQVLDALLRVTASATTAAS